MNNFTIKTNLIDNEIGVSVVRALSVCNLLGESVVQMKREQKGRKEGEHDVSRHES